MALLGPSTDYTDKDFDALNARLDNLIVSAFPTWTDQERSNFGNILKELFAFVGDVLTKYQDNQAAEAFIGRVTQRKNILALCKLIGFEPRGNTASQVELAISLTSALAGDVTIPARTRMKTESIVDPIVFETVADAVITAGDTGPIIVLAEHAEERSQTFTSTNLPNQTLSLSGTPYLDGSLVVTASNGAFTQVDSLLESTSSDRHYVVAVDQNERALVRFGNGTSGVIPAGTITCAYKIGGGSVGVVEAGKIARVEGSFTDALGNAARLTITNPSPSTPALDRQSVEEIRQLAPRSLRTQNRTVSREDYEINALRVPGVVRALMLTSDQDTGILENEGILFVVASGSESPPDYVIASVLEMCTITYPNTLTFALDVQGAPFVDVDVSVLVHLAKGVRASVVDAAIRDRLTRAFAVEPTAEDVSAGLTVGVDFGYNLTTADGDPGLIAWSDVFNIVRDTAGVRKIDDGSDGLLLNGVRGDFEIGLRNFPRLGTVTILNAATGTPLV